jgi:hypothetical protein
MAATEGYFDTNPYRNSSCPSCNKRRNSFGKCATDECNKNYVKALCGGCGRDKMQSYHRGDSTFPKPNKDIRPCRVCNSQEVTYK